MSPKCYGSTAASKAAGRGSTPWGFAKQHGFTLCKPSCTVRFFFSAIGEMDIITVFETVGGGSIPSWPARQSAYSSRDRTVAF
jgi:hypothetical protein